MGRFDDDEREDAMPLRDRLPDYGAVFGVGLAACVAVGLVVWVVSTVSLASSIGYTVILYGVVAGVGINVARPAVPVRGAAYLGDAREEAGPPPLAVLRPVNLPQQVGARTNGFKLPRGDTFPPRNDEAPV